jgi:K+-transporting ATPase ATPase B chain
MMGDGTMMHLWQANVVAMNSGTQAAKEAGNMVDLDNDPTKLIEIIEIGKQLLMTRGTLLSLLRMMWQIFSPLFRAFITAIPALKG